MPIPLVHSLRNSLSTSRRFFFLGEESDLNLGYIALPFITGSISSISYRPFNQNLLVFNNVDNKAVVVGVDDFKIFNSINNLPEPVKPTIYFPESSIILFKGNGGIDSDGLYGIDRNDNLVTINEIADDLILSVDDLIYSITDRSVYILDTSKSVVHKLYDDLSIDFDFISLIESINELSDVSFSDNDNTLYISDSGNNTIQYISNLSFPSKGRIDLSPLKPRGVAWSPKEELLYTSDLISSQLKVYSWNSQNLIDVTNSVPDYNGTIVKLGYNSIKREVYTITVDSINNTNSLAFINTDSSNNISVTGQIYSPFDGSIPLEEVEEENFFFLSFDNKIRKYRIYQNIDKEVRIGTNSDLLDPLKFSGEEGLIATNSLTATIINNSLKTRSVGFYLYNNFSNYITESDSIIKLFTIKDKDKDTVILMMSFDSGVVLAVDANLEVIKKMSTEDISIARSNGDVLLNPNQDGPYIVNSFDYSETFKILYVCFENGKSENSDSKNGLVVAFDISNGITSSNPIAFSEAPDFFSKFSSIVVNKIGNNLHVLGESSSNSVLRIHDLEPDNGEIILKASKTADKDTTNLELFNNRVYFASNESSKLYSLGTSIKSDFKETTIQGHITQLKANDDFGFIHLLDDKNYRILSMNEAQDIYSSTYFKEKPKSMTDFGDSVYVLYEGTSITLPSLSNSINQNESVNLIEFDNPIGTELNIGDVVTLEHLGNTYYLVSLSNNSKDSKVIYIETFSPFEDINPTDTTVSLKGNIISKVNQTALVRDSGKASKPFFNQFTLEDNFDYTYSINFEPYLLTNSSNSPILQSTQGNYNILGDLVNKPFTSLYYVYKEYIYFITEDSLLFRVHLTNRWLQFITLKGTSNNLADLKDFVIIDDGILSIYNFDKNLYFFTLHKQNSSILEYQLEDSLAFSDNPDSIDYNFIENNLNVRINKSTVKVKI